MRLSALVEMGDFRNCFWPPGDMSIDVTVRLGRGEGKIIELNSDDVTQDAKVECMLCGRRENAGDSIDAETSSSLAYLRGCDEGAVSYSEVVKT